MEVDRIFTETDSQEVDALDPQPRGQPSHPSPFGLVDRVDRVVPTGGGSNLHSDQGRAVAGDEIDLTTLELDVCIVDCQAVVGEEPGRKTFPRFAEGSSRVDQMGSSEFSSSSTLTSRKVRTWT